MALAQEQAEPAAAEEGAFDPSVWWAGIDQRNEYLAQMEDRPPEGIEDEELERCDELKARLLKAQGLEVRPQGWTGAFYLKHTLLRYLRAKGSLEESLAALQKTHAWGTTTSLEMARQYEQDHPCHKKLAQKYTPEGPFGYDRRGAPVLYARCGLRDIAGIYRETSEEFYLRFYLDKIMRDGCHFAVVNAKNEKCGCNWMGSVFVMDLDGLTWSRGAALVEFVMLLTNSFMRDHFPEVTITTFIVNVPWFFSMGWTLLTPFIPKTTKSKFKIFGAGDNFMPELEEFVAREQVPSWLGGLSPHPWPHGEGGDVPVGAGKLQPGLSPDGHRTRKPSWIKVAAASAAGSIKSYKAKAERRHSIFRSDKVGCFDPDDRSLGLSLPRTTGSSSATSPKLMRRRGKAAGSSAASDKAGDGSEHGDPGWPCEGRLLEFAALAAASFGLHAWLRCSGVHSACAILGTLLGACASFQLPRCLRRSRPSGHAAAAAAPAEAGRAPEAAGPGQRLPLPREGRAAEPGSCSLRSDSGSSESSWAPGKRPLESVARSASEVSSVFCPSRSAGGSETSGGGEASSGATDAWALPLLANALGQLAELPGDGQAAWTDGVEAWADRRRHSLQLCQRGPESGWQSDLPYRCLPGQEQSERLPGER